MRALSSCATVTFPDAYWYAPGAALYLGDLIDQLRNLSARSIHCIITSPPYWALRDYGTGDGQIGNELIADCLGWATGKLCTGFGPGNWTSGCFVCHMVVVLRELHRVLRDDGTLWLNLGDTYAGGMTGGTGTRSTIQGKECNKRKMFDRGSASTGVDSGNLVGIPWRVALAVQSDGWVMRNDIIWQKSSGMPESVTNRCSKSHEHIFLLTKKDTGYYFDNIAIQEEAKSDPKANIPTKFIPTSKKDKLDVNDKIRSAATSASANNRDDTPYTHANKRDVWTVAAAYHSGNHFATFPPKLITPCILSGTSEYGCCANCGTPWKRVVVRTDTVDKPTLDEVIARKETAGWQKACACATNDIVPAIVLDPFVGSGTTVATSLSLGRQGVGIDLNEKYIREDAIPRIEQALTAVPEVKGLVALVERTQPTPKRLRGS